jgi:uncharacterized protein (TIGR01777 family)
MRIVIAGGSGFLGSPLAEMYAEEGHDVRILSRSLKPGEMRHDSGTGVPGITRVGWNADGKTGSWSAVLEGADALINLAGESIAGKRWTPKRKALLRDSRILPTRGLAAAMREAAQPPPVFVSGSAVGYYGPAGDEARTEASPAGAGFLAQLCDEWEREAQAAARSGVRVVLLRSGIAIEKSGGALPEMMRPFRFFVGGPMGSGRQYISWIHRLDWIEIVRWIVQTPEVSGPVNATAPHPVTNRQFARALGRAMRRPSIVPAPSFALKLVLGELAQSILTGQRVLPTVAQKNGYHFRYPELDQAFRGIFGD